MPSILTLTLNPAVDKSCSVDQVVPGRKLRCGTPQFFPGGGGLNVARAITELGGSVAAYWMCGGVIGQLLAERLDQEGIDHYPIPITAMTRENLVVLEESSGQQYRFGMPGATLSEDEIESCIKRLTTEEPPAYLVLSGSLPPGADDGLYARIADAMPDSCRVVLDTSGPALQLGLRSPAFLIKPNLNELEQLGGTSVDDDSKIRDIAQSLIEQGKTETVVTSLGSGGVMVTTSEDHVHIRAPTVKIRSKVGAGDSTVAGIVLALVRGESIVDAVRFGVAAGSAAVMTKGTQLCRREDTERLYREMSTIT
jgi:6-phosphofructokinase 2